MEYIRYWFEFDIKSFLDYPPGIGIGCGVTAIDYQDAIGILQRKIFKGEKIPPIKSVRADVDIQSLDQGHVIPNMRSPHSRGIWFPLGYEEDVW